MRAIGTGVLGLALVLTAAGFGSPSLYVPGIALLLLAALAAAWVLLAASGASLERRVGPATVEEEKPWPLQVVASTGMLPAPGGELREPLIRGALPMAGRAHRHLRVTVRFEKRGRRRLEPARLTIRDPLGILERQFECGAEQEVLVLPRVEPVVVAGPGAGAAAEGSSAARPAESAAEVEMESLRPYREGAPASRIHWPTVARAGDLMERRLLADSDVRPLVVLDPRRTVSDDDGALDMAVRAAASLCVHLARQRGCALFLPGDRRPTEIEPDLTAWKPLHSRLALVEASTAAPAVRVDVQRGAVYWITVAPLTRLPRVLDRLHADRYLVAPGDPAGRPAFTVAGCAGVLLGRGQRRAA